MFRVSNLVQGFRCLTDLQELEPETYNQLERLKGVHTAIYGKKMCIH
jgi:hypothetical protein